MVVRVRRYATRRNQRPFFFIHLDLRVSAPITLHLITYSPFWESGNCIKSTQHRTFYYEEKWRQLTQLNPHTFFSLTWKSIPARYFALKKYLYSINDSEKFLILLQKIIMKKALTVILQSWNNIQKNHNSICKSPLEMTSIGYSIISFGSNWTTAV